MDPKKLISDSAGLLKKIAKKVNKGTPLNYKEQFALQKFQGAVDFSSGTGDSGALFTMDYIQKTFKITRQTLADWRKQGFPSSEKKAVHSDDVLTWFRERMLHYREASNGNGKGKHLNDAKLEKTHAETTLLNMRIEEEAGRLVERDGLEREFHKHLSTASQMIQGLDRQLSRYVPRNHRANFIKEARRELVELLNSLVNLGVADNAKK